MEKKNKHQTPNMKGQTMPLSCSRAIWSYSHDGPPNAKYDWNLPSLNTLLDISRAIEFDLCDSNSKAQFANPSCSLKICSVKARYRGHSQGLSSDSNTGWQSEAHTTSDIWRSRRLWSVEIMHRNSAMIMFGELVNASRAWNITHPEWSLADPICVDIIMTGGMIFSECCPYFCSFLQSSSYHQGCRFLCASVDNCVPIFSNSP